MNRFKTIKCIALINVYLTELFKMLTTVILKKKLG